MAACGSLRHIFENPLPENSTLLESLSSWNQIKPTIKPIEQSSFTEIFGELHFKENSPQSSSSSSSSSAPSSFPIIGNLENSTFKLSKNHSFHENDDADNKILSTPELFSSNLNSSNCHKKSERFSLNYESLQLCTEGLGFESSDDVEDMKNNNDMKKEWQIISKDIDEKTTTGAKTEQYLNGGHQQQQLRRSSKSSGVCAFPPPISCIGKSGKPWVCFKSYRQDGRFVLKEVIIPTQEFLHAYREDGRLKLQFVQPNDEILDDEEEEEEDDDDDDLINDDINEDEEKRQVRYIITLRK